MNILWMVITIYGVLQIFGMLATFGCYAQISENEDHYILKLFFIPFTTAVTYSVDLTIMGKIFFIFLDVVFLPIHLFMDIVTLCVSGIYNLCVRQKPERDYDDYD